MHPSTDAPMAAGTYPTSEHSCNVSAGWQYRRHTAESYPEMRRPNSQAASAASAWWIHEDLRRPPRGHHGSVVQRPGSVRMGRRRELRQPVLRPRNHQGAGRRRPTMDFAARITIGIWLLVFLMFGLIVVASQVVW